MKQSIFILVAIVFAMTFAACSTQKRATVKQELGPQNQERSTAMAGVGHQFSSPGQTDVLANTSELVPADNNGSNTVVDEKLEQKTTSNIAASTKTIKKAKSFAQMKQMVQNGELNMSAKDIKTLNKLDKLYKKDFNTYRADAFEMTSTAKIIAGVGAASALIAIFVGSWFFAFLFLLAILAFLLRWMDIIDF